jgi:hypothetical protein
VWEKRQEVLPLAEEPDYFKKQWQGMIVFDEFYDLTRNYRLDRTMKTVSRIGTQGRQDGVSLVIATQTLFGGHKEKVPISQAASVFQFLPSSKSDQNFVMRTMGWEGSVYENLTFEIFSKVFPVTRDKQSHKGKVTLFSKETSTVNALKLKLLD